MTDRAAVDLSPEAVKALCLGLEDSYGRDAFQRVDIHPRVQKAMTVIRALAAALADAQRERDENVARLKGQLVDYATEQEVATQDLALTKYELSTERADHARTRAMLGLLSDAADEMNGEIDRQVIDEMRRAEYDPPDDAEFVIMLTTKQMRALNDPICVCQKYLRDTASTSAETPSRQLWGVGPSGDVA